MMNDLTAASLPVTQPANVHYKPVLQQDRAEALICPMIQCGSKDVCRSHCWLGVELVC
jgi:hypothetical protein